MLNKEAFDQWCWRLGLSDQAKAVITHIRTSLPARRVRSSAGNVSGTYPSLKMGFAIQFESHRNELPFAYLIDHDPDVLELYSQPAGEIKLKYRNQDDTRDVTARHTPDFFVLRGESAGWVECKMEKDLVQLAKKMPFRYQQRPDGSWFCPPGEAYAAQFGLTYRVFSSQEIDWIYIENLRFLADYLRKSPPPVPTDVALAIRTTVMSQPGICLSNLITTLHRGKADAVYQLILTHQLYIDLRAIRLTDYEHVQVFLDPDQAQSYATLQPTTSTLPRPSILQLTVGAPIVLDGKLWTIFNPGVTEILLLSEDRQVMPVPNDAFDELIRNGRVTGLSQPTPPPRYEEGRELRAQASATPRAMRSRRKPQTMNEAQVLELLQWNLTVERLPRRSMLYAPAPVGLGTAMGESLTSYLARLAVAHCVYPGVLLREMILPMLAEAETQENAPEQHPLWRRDGSGSHLINVTGSRAQAALQVLETLTMRTDLSGLSLAALTEILPLRGLTRNRLAWCPLCYEEWLANEQVVYDPLLWKFREVSLCVCHGVRLQTACPNCARSLPHLAWRSRPGYCPFCAWPLFGEQAERQESIDPGTSEFAWQQWASEELGAVVAWLPSAQGSLSRERIRLAVNHVVERLAGGNIATFARFLDLPRNTVENWCQGKRIPEMDMLLRLCYRLNLSLDEMLFQEAETLRPRLRDPIPEACFQSRKRTAIDKERIFYLLEQAAKSTEDPPTSLREVGQQLGYQPTTLYKINRAACHAIAERFTAYRCHLREKRLQEYREEIRRIVLRLQAERVALTRKHIERYLVQPAILRDPKVRELLREICRELEASSGGKSQ